MAIADLLSSPPGYRWSMISTPAAEWADLDKPGIAGEWAAGDEPR
ncbi:hypothetical protein AB0F91_21195 [Amycolatopsis sp. NPDC023774]